MRTLVHPCDKLLKGGCEQQCNKEHDGFSCSCEPGKFKLAADGKTCDKSKYDILYSFNTLAILDSYWLRIRCHVIQVNILLTDSLLIKIFCTLSITKISQYSQNMSK